MSFPGRVVSLTDAATLVRAAQNSGHRVVLCHGCFDIVHPGHVRHLQHAARLGDRLIVTVTNDAAVNKGDARPLIPQELRAENLAALDCVDWACVNPLDTAAALLEHIRPDIYVKGREYEDNGDPRFAAEKAIVERSGGRVVFTSGDVVFSSTALIAAMEATADPRHGQLRALLDQADVHPSTIDPLVTSFCGRRVLVVGETLIDTYVMCDRPDVSGESPMMTLRPIETRSFDGGAAIIARHLAAMGARPTLVTALPRDDAALRTRLTAEGIDVHSVDIDQQLIQKERYLVGATKVMKVDRGESMTIDDARHHALHQLVADCASTCDAAIIADYGAGLFTPPKLGELCQMLRDRVDLLVGDVSSRRSSLLAFRDMDLLCPSETEIRDALNDFDGGLSEIVWRVLDQTHTRRAIVTIGPEGALAFDRRRTAEDPEGWSARLVADHVPSFAPFAVDQLGCGDALLAGATLTLLAGGELIPATILGSIAAAVEAQRLGNAVIGAPELRRGIRRICGAQLTYAAGPAVSVPTLSPRMS